MRLASLLRLSYCFLFLVLTNLCLASNGDDNAPKAEPAKFTSPKEKALAQPATASPMSTPVEPAAEAPPTESVPTDEPVVPLKTPEGKTLFAPVVFREKAAFKIYYADIKDSETVLQRARTASQALEKALKAPDPLTENANLVETSIRGSILEVRIRGYKVVELTDKDRIAAGFENLEEYQEQVRTEFNAFMDKELDRVQVQKIALQFFLSVFFALMGFVVFRQVRVAFNKADHIIDHKRESFKPLVLMSENLVSGQTIGGLLAITLVVGRIFAYLLVILTTLAAIFGQFEFSQELLRTFFSQSFSQFLKTVQSIIATIPSLLLGVVLLFIWHLALKILDLFLKGVKSERISWAFLGSHRVPIVKFWGTVILSALFFPLIIAAFFGRFHTPLETIALMVAATLALAALPIVASLAAGSFVLWQRAIDEGQRIQIGKSCGTIIDVNLHQIKVEAVDGNVLYVPMLQLMLQSWTISKSRDVKSYEIKLVRKQSIAETLQVVKKLFADDSKALVTCLSMSASEYQIGLAVSVATSANVIGILSDAHDQGKIQLGSELVKEV